VILQHWIMVLMVTMGGDLHHVVWLIGCWLVSASYKIIHKLKKNKKKCSAEKGNRQSIASCKIRAPPVSLRNWHCCFLLSCGHETLQFYWFYSGSYPPNCWRGILHLCRHQGETLNWLKALLEEKQEKHLGRWHPNLPTKIKFATQKGAGDTETLEPHKTGRNRPRAASSWSQRE